MENTFVMVTTEKKGVFAGTLLNYDAEKKVAHLKNVRMCVMWTSSRKGVLGLAANGPDNKDRITPAASEAILEGVTAIFSCAEKARKKWEAEPWG